MKKWRLHGSKHRAGGHGATLCFVKITWLKMLSILVPVSVPSVAAALTCLGNSVQLVAPGYANTKRVNVPRNATILVQSYSIGNSTSKAVKLWLKKKGGGHVRFDRTDVGANMVWFAQLKPHRILRPKTTYEVYWQRTGSGRKRILAGTFPTATTLDKSPPKSRISHWRCAQSSTATS